MPSDITAHQQVNTMYNVMYYAVHVYMYVHICTCRLHVYACYIHVIQVL
jgi:hypothetical protein